MTRPFAPMPLIVNALASVIDMSLPDVTSTEEKLLLVFVKDIFLVGSAMSVRAPDAVTTPVAEIAPAEAVSVVGVPLTVRVPE